jgi:uncharacterized protein (TIGR03435 family)
MTCRTIALLIVTATVSLPGQQPTGAPRFEVVSIRPNRAARVEERLDLQPSGRIIWIGTKLRPLIRLAYNRRMFDTREVVGGPDWLDTDRFDIVAQANEPLRVDPDGFPREPFAMIRTMLAERFGLRVHEDRRERPIYQLVRARGADLGSRLQRSSIDCGKEMADQAKGNRPRLLADGRAACALGGPPGRLLGAGLGMPQLAAALVRLVGREVVDRTQLDGAFDWDIEFRPEMAQPFGNEPAPASDAFNDRPSIFTALQEQLGLRLESTKGFVDVLVIDAVSGPTAD